MLPFICYAFNQLPKIISPSLVWAGKLTSCGRVRNFQFHSSLSSSLTIVPPSIFLSLSLPIPSLSLLLSPHLPLSLFEHSSHFVFGLFRLFVGSRVAVVVHALPGGNDGRHGRHETHEGPGMVRSGARCCGGTIIIDKE